MTKDEQHRLFESWLAQHAAVLHHVAHGFADGEDRHDLMQELLLALWRAVPAFRGGAVRQPSFFGSRTTLRLPGSVPNETTGSGWTVSNATPVLPWIAAVFFAREYRRHRARYPNYERSIADSLRASLDENRLSVMRLKVISALLLAMVLLMPLIVHQLRAVGKAGDEVLLPAFVLFPLFVVIELGALAYYHRRKLQPRKRQLEAILHSYE